MKKRLISFFIILTIILSGVPAVSSESAPLENFALNKSVTTYYHDMRNEDGSFVPCGDQDPSLPTVTDGVLESYAYGASGRWIHRYVIDLEEVKTDVNEIVVSFFKQGEHGEPVAYDVAVSEDGVNWECVGFVADGNNSLPITTRKFTFANRKARYVWLEGTKANPNCAMFVAEIEVYSNPDNNVTELENYAKGAQVKLLLPHVTGKENEVDELKYPHWEFGSLHSIPSNATDGFETTATVAAGNYQWQLQIDMGRIIDNINTVKLHFGDSVDANNYAPLKFEVYGSTDGVIWDLIKTHDFGTIDNKQAIVTVDFPSQSLRYIRVKDFYDTEFNLQGSRIQMCIGEIKVFSDPGKKPGLVNFAKDAPVKLLHPAVTGEATAEYELMYPFWEMGNLTCQPLHATDGKLSTYTVAAGNYQWQLQIDMGSIIDNVNTVKLYFGDGTNPDNFAPLKFELYGSQDGVNWWYITTHDFGTIAQKQGVVQLNIPSQDIRFIRVKDAYDYEQNSHGNRIQMTIGEIEVYRIDENYPIDYTVTPQDNSQGVNSKTNVVFEFTLDLPYDYQVEFKNSANEDVEFSQDYDKENKILTIISTENLLHNQTYTVTVQSALVGEFAKTTFSTPTQVLPLTITSKSTSEYATDPDYAIYPAFVDNFKYQSWTMERGYDYYQLKNSGGGSRIKWEILSGTLPDGLSMSKDGKIAGIATKEGDFTFTVKATDEYGNSDTKTLTMTAKPFRSKWHEEAKYGVMIQWGPYSEPAITTKEELYKFEQRTVNFDAEVWAQKIADMGGRVLNFTVVAGDGVRLWPSTTPSVLETKTGRNYVKELIDACHKRGIKFIGYMPGGFNWTPAMRDHALDGTQSTLHYGLISELIDMGMDGMWIDAEGSIGDPLRFNWDVIVPMIRTKNPDFLIGSNSIGFGLGFLTNYPYIDYKTDERDIIGLSRKAP